MHPCIHPSTHPAMYSIPCTHSSPSPSLFFSSSSSKRHDTPTHSPPGLIQTRPRGSFNVSARTPLHSRQGRKDSPDQSSPGSASFSPSAAVGGGSGGGGGGCDTVARLCHCSSMSAAAAAAALDVPLRTLQAQRVLDWVGLDRNWMDWVFSSHDAMKLWCEGWAQHRARGLEIAPHWPLRDLES